MKITDDRPPNKRTRNLGVYKEDLDEFDKAATALVRSRAGMFRWVVSEWKAGRAVYAPIGKPQFKRQVPAKNGKAEK